MPVRCTVLQSALIDVPETLVLDLSFDQVMVQNYTSVSNDHNLFQAIVAAANTAGSSDEANIRQKGAVAQISRNEIIPAERVQPPDCHLGQRLLMPMGAQPAKPESCRGAWNGEMSLGQRDKSFWWKHGRRA